MGVRLTVGLATVSLALATSSAAVAAPSPPTPAPLFAAYQDLCVHSQGDPVQALAAAGAAGWREPKASDMLPLDALSMSDGQQRETMRGGARLHLAVGHAKDPAQLGADSAPWRVCIVSAEPADPAAASALQQWAGVAPIPDSNADADSLLFVFTGPPQGHRSVGGMTAADVHRLVLQRAVIAAGVKTVGAFTVLLYAAPGS